jgi:hypothetical protein
MPSASNATGVFLGLAAAIATSLLCPDAFAGNEKSGTVGAVPGQVALPYTIRFENPASATGPAQQVVVSDPLDMNTLDPHTVSLDAITFGSVRIVPPPGLRSYATQVDLRPGKNLLVNVSAAVDLFTGVLSWYFSSIDPATGQPPTDPLNGFLPPNTVPPEGEGSVLFTVLPVPNLPGTTIDNRAAIVFDEGPVNYTNVWQNTVDNVAPASHVLPLANYSDESTILVEWAAEGAPTDLRDFTIYVSEDGAPYRLWRLNTEATADTLIPPSNHQFHEYSFYSIARDVIGNVESPPGTPDATTLSRTAVEGPGSWKLVLDGAQPNPAKGTINVRFTLPSSKTATLEVIDVAGRRVLRREVGGLGPGHHVMALTASQSLRTGVYLLRLVQGSVTLSSRVAIVE